jgi:dTDP-glucose 4,6-dehydratase
MPRKKFRNSKSSCENNKEGNHVKKNNFFNNLRSCHARYDRFSVFGSLQALSPHISSDITAEKLVEGYYLSDNLPAAIVRLFNTYGPVQSRDAVIPTIIAQSLVGEKLFLGDMRPIRDFVYVDDVVEGLMKAAETPESVGEAINLGSGQSISIGDLADKIVALIGRDVEILFDATRLRTQSPDIERLVADITKANHLLSWQPKTSLDDGLKKTIKWFSTS